MSCWQYGEDVFPVNEAVKCFLLLFWQGLDVLKAVFESYRHYLSENSLRNELIHEEILENAEYLKIQQMLAQSDKLEKKKPIPTLVKSQMEVKTP